jgi:hypothetical protein
MKKNLWKLILFTLLLLSLTSCRFTAGNRASNLSAATLVSQPTSLPVPSDTPQPTAIATPAPSPTATTADAEQTVQAYFAALQSGDYQTAAGYVSNLSLAVDNMTLSDGVDELKNLVSGGAKWSNLQVLGAQLFDPNTVLVHVSYQFSGKDAKTGKTSTENKDELWPVGFENGSWLYNRNNLIDFHDLNNPAQTTDGMTVKPLRLARYSDRVSLIMLVQNGTPEDRAWGLSTEKLAIFTFGGKQVDAVQKQIYFSHLQSYFDTTIDVMGLYTSYPDSVELRHFTNSTVAPWFTFKFN